MSSNRKPSVLIESPINPHFPFVESDFKLARSICQIAATHGYMPLHTSSYLHWMLSPTVDKEQFDKLYEQMIRGCKPRTFWMVLRESDNRVTRQMLSGLKLALNMGLHVRYFRTSDDGKTIKEVTNFDA